jgi:methionine-rich copper-binding protein CopC
MRRALKHPVTILAAATVLVASFGATGAWAHVKVKSTSPKAGASVKKSLKSVKVLFTGPIRSGTLKVYTAGGTKVSKGNGGRDPRNINRLIVGLKGGLKAGRYTAKWSIIAADGHKQNGSFGFRLKN